MKTENHDSEEVAQPNKPKASELTTMKTLSFAIQFGFMIAIPLLGFIFIGKWLSAKYDNEAFLYGGLVLALLTSTAWFYKRITALHKDFID